MMQIPFRHYALRLLDISQLDRKRERDKQAGPWPVGRLLGSPRSSPLWLLPCGPRRGSSVFQGALRFFRRFQILQS